MIDLEKHRHGMQATLSIAIATRNRARYLERQLEQLRSCFSSVGFEDYEVVVSNNHSADNTQGVVDGYASLDSRVVGIRPPRPCETAEENFNFAITACRGRYVWTLGDDDVILRAGIEVLVQVIQVGGVGVFLFNSEGISNDGRLICRAKYPIWGPQLRGKFLDLVINCGLTYVLAGYSNVVFAREKYDPIVFQEYFGLSKIYSHVTTMIDLFRDCESQVLNVPLVSYRRNLYAEVPNTHWVDHTTKDGVFDHFPWSLGLSRPLSRLVEKGVFQWYQLSQIIDQGESTRHRWINDHLRYVVNQIRKDLEGTSRVQMTSAEYEEWYVFIKKALPEEWNLLFLFEEFRSAYADAGLKGNFKSKNLKETLTKLTETLDSRLLPLGQQFLVAEIGEKSLFCHNGSYFFVPRSALKSFQPLHWIDYINHPLVERVDIANLPRFELEVFGGTGAMFESSVDPDPCSRGGQIPSVTVNNSLRTVPRLTLTFALNRLGVLFLKRFLPRKLRERIYSKLA